MSKTKIVRRGRNTLDLSLRHYNSPKGRTFDGVVTEKPEGSKGFDVNKGLGIATAGIDFLNAAVGNAQTEDRNDIESNLDYIYNYNSNQSDYDSLLGSYKSFKFDNNNYTGKDYMQNTGDYLKRTGKATISGATAGASFGPIGAIIGGVAGLASGLGGWAASAVKAKKQADRINAYKEDANERALYSFKNNANNIQNQQMQDMLRSYMAYGGPLSTNGTDFNNGLTMVDTGGSHEESPLDGVPMGVAPDGVPNLVEEGEVIFNNYVFSNRLSPSRDILRALNLPDKYNNHTYAYIAERLGRESEERPNDPISKAGLQDAMMRLLTAQETTRQRQSMKKNKGHKFAGGGWTEFLRYAPVVESGLTTLTDSLGFTNKPDYSNAERIENAGNSIREISAPQLGDYLSYTPFDREYYANQLKAQGAATRRAVRNLSGLNRGTAVSSLLAADYNNSIGLGNLFRQGLEYNQAQKERVATFNRGTNQANMEAILNAGKSNQTRDAEVAKYLTSAANLRESIIGTTSRNKSANLDNFAMNLGSVGKEEYIKTMIRNNPALLYDYLGRYKEPATMACGGKLRTKKKRK